MTLFWLCLHRDALPSTDQWLGPRERETFATLTLPKRRSDWLLGRYVAKRALSHVGGFERLDVLDIVASEDGAPEAFFGDRRLPFHVSISHRNELGACAVARIHPVGCDLEAIEPRTAGFVADYFTREERVAVQRASAADRNRLIALTWSAKESALKVLRVGLRRDTRKVQVRLLDDPTVPDEWHRLEAHVEPEGRTLQGWWRQLDRHALTLVSEGPATTSLGRVPEGPTARPTVARSAHEMENS